MKKTFLAIALMASASLQAYDVSVPNWIQRARPTLVRSLETGNLFFQIAGDGINPPLYCTYTGSDVLKNRALSVLLTAISNGQLVTFYKTGATLDGGLSVNYVSVEAP